MSNAKAQEALRTWYQDVKQTYTSAGQDVNTFKDTVVADLNNIDKESLETKGVVNEMTAQMNYDMNAVMREALEMDRR